MGLKSLFKWLLVPVMAFNISYGVLTYASDSDTVQITPERKEKLFDMVKNDQRKKQKENKKGYYNGSEYPFLIDTEFGYETTIQNYFKDDFDGDGKLEEILDLTAYCDTSEQCNALRFVGSTYYIDNDMVNRIENNTFMPKFNFIDFDGDNKIEIVGLSYRSGQGLNLTNLEILKLVDGNYKCVFDQRVAIDTTNSGLGIHSKDNINVDSVFNGYEFKDINGDKIKDLILNETKETYYYPERYSCDRVLKSSKKVTLKYMWDKKHLKFVEYKGKK